MRIFSAAIALATFVVLSTASAAIPKYAEPNPNAPKGGTIVRSLGGEPPTLHPIMATDLYAQHVWDFVLDTLLERKATDWEWAPRLADKWEISKDGKVFTFHIRENATWHDGKPVTAEDVKFSFDAIFEPKYQAAQLIPYYEGISKAEVVDAHTVKFTAKDGYYKNFDSVASLNIIPKHVYQDVEKSKKMTRTLVGSGPYSLEKFDRGQKIILKRNTKWAAANDPYYKGAYNFDTIDLRFYKEENIEIEHAKKGELDIIELRAESYEKKTSGAPWGTKLFKKKVENEAPKSYNFIGWNFRREIFQDKKVRLALAHLMNREEINKKFMYGYSSLVRGPSFNSSEYASASVKPILFDPKEAQKLLAEAGWTDSDKDGILDKTINGKKVPFKFSLIYPNKDTEKYWTLYQQDLKKAGIDLELKYMEWNSFLKLLDDGNFDAAALAWGANDLDWEPKQIWHSSSAVPGGSNFIYYKNPEVDKLIDDVRVTPDKTKRVEKLRKVYEIIANDAPYVFLFEPKYTFYANSSKMGLPGDTLKYSTGLAFWWMQAK
jgi:peptide/nickel transport system substrate-binding protein/microcin C transport system substrate-binding protein